MYTEEGEAKRRAVNDWIRTSEAFDGVLDFDAAVRDSIIQRDFVLNTTPETTDIPTMPAIAQLETPSICSCLLSRSVRTWPTLAISISAIADARYGSNRKISVRSAKR
jgi:hypothetical protein